MLFFVIYVQKSRFFGVWISDQTKETTWRCHFGLWLIHICITSGAKQLLSRPDDQPSPSKGCWLLHLQSQLWRCFWIQPVGSSGCPECRLVLRYNTIVCQMHFCHKHYWHFDLNQLECLSHWGRILMMSFLSPPPGQSYHSLEGRLKVVIQPQSQQLQVGENLQLECGAVGRPIPRYQWHRNGVPVPSSTKRKLLVRKLLFLWFYWKLCVNRKQLNWK